MWIVKQALRPLFPSYFKTETSLYETDKDCTCNNNEKQLLIHFYCDL